MNKYRIYVVDDDADDLEILQEVFEKSGCAKEIELLASMEDLFAKLNNASVLPDLVVLDNQSPGTLGSEALETLRADEKYKNVTLAVYSTHITPSKEQELLQKGADACFSKGSTVDEIAEHVKRFCEATERRKKNSR